MRCYRKILRTSYTDHVTSVEVRTTRRPPDYRKETQTAVVWSCLPFIRSGENHIARHSERGEDHEDLSRANKTVEKLNSRVAVMSEEIQDVLRFY